MNKMQIAHEWYMKHGKDNVMEKSIACAWQYADAMQAEADKRECKERPEVLESVDPKEYIDAVLQDIVDQCDHEWTHIKYFGAEGDFYVCPCGAKSKHARGRK